MDRVFVDTGAWLSLANRKDARHDAVLSAIQEWSGRLVTSNFILDELVTLAHARLGHDIAVGLGERLLNPDMVHLARLTSEDEAASLNLFRRRPDQRYSFTDCTSFVLMKRMGIGVALALDSDFLREGFEVIPS